jgi:hypothetical protein
MIGWMWRPAEAEAINRRAPRSKGGRIGPGTGQVVWPGPIDPGPFRPGSLVSLPDASRSIVDLLPYECGPLTSSSPWFT